MKCEQKALDFHGWLPAAAGRDERPYGFPLPVYADTDNGIRGRNPFIVLITHSLEEYEALALKLATTPALLSDVKARLARNRTTYPLFDTDRFHRHPEAACVTMWERVQRGERPESFAVQPIKRVIQ